jgi:lipopolysaccharide export LptBFGC system permease protein LptF
VSGLRLIHRYLLVELLRNAVVSLVVVFSIFFLAALSIQVGRSHSENLPMVAVLKYVALLLLYTAYLTIPVCVITTCIFTYGRAAQDGEIAAAQTSGIRINGLLIPGVFIGACAMLLLAVIQNRVMPEAHFLSRQVDESVFMNVEQLLKRRDKSIREKDFVFQWQSVGEDATGNLILEDVELVTFKDRKKESSTRARRARPVAEPGSTRVTLELEDVQREQDGAGFWAGRIEVPIDLSALVPPRVRSGENQLTYEELLSGAVSSRTEKRSNRLFSEFHFRMAMAIAPFLFAAFAAPFGIALRIRNRAVVFLAGVLVMTGGYLPLVAVGKSLAERGTVPAWAGLQAPNVVLAVVALYFLRKVQRP